MVNDRSTTRREQLASLSRTHEGERDLYQVMGYPATIAPETFVEMYQRGDIAARIAEAYPDACWATAPEMTSEKHPQLIDEFRELNDRLGVIDRLHHFDLMTQLGRWGILVIGVADGKPLHEPLVYADKPAVVYLQAHPEASAKVLQWNTDPSSPRYGLPLSYQIAVGSTDRQINTSEDASRLVNVHYTRVIHAAENPLNNPAVGVPRLQQVYNRLADVRKVAGSSAEIYWQNVAQILAFIADGESEFSPEAQEDMRKQLVDMQHGLRRSLRLRGMTIQQLAAGLQGSTPDTHIGVQIDLIAGTTGIPKRILMGNEAGELASTQDQTSFMAHVQERREGFCRNCILFPFVSKMQRLGAMSNFVDFDFTWQEMDFQSPEQKAASADTRAAALQKYLMTPGADRLITREEFRVMLGLPAEIEQFQEDI